MAAARSLAWADVAARLAPVRSYWLATVDASGVPHTVPVWGAIADEVLYFMFYPGTAKERHLAANPAVAVHLPDPEDVLIVEGHLERVGSPADRPEVLTAFRAKYVDPDDLAWLPSSGSSVEVVVSFEPRRAISWVLANFEGSQARWETKV